ncbi:hypothetical protein [Bradyrhizobium hipponense]|uniref:hypothetical protein n=1 Tax=Bradyrhizobium hipponense TaxID=2605638 RepID=UPI001652D9F7|nr:hypothetical protein [Bradyrhizobium hipponense]
MLDIQGNAPEVASPVRSVREPHRDFAEARVHEHGEGVAETRVLPNSASHANAGLIG